MHTYIKDDATYYVGMWLPNERGTTAFMRMFRVKTLEDAQYAVNFLNGGVSKSYDEFRIAEECP